MRAISSGRRGVSEVVAALLLLSITVGVFGVFYTYYVSGLNSSGGSVAKGIQDSAKATGELMSLVSYQVQGSTVTLYLYNYGLQPITLNPPIIPPVAPNLSQRGRITESGPPVLARSIFPMRLGFEQKRG